MTQETKTVEKYIAEYLSTAYFMQIGTSVNNVPWVCTVHVATNDRMDLIWVSEVSSRHSQDIEKNAHVAGALVLPQRPDVPVWGIQFQGEAQKVTDETEARELLSSYRKRFVMDEASVTKIALGDGPHACYVIQPSVFVLFDQIHFPDAPRQEYVVPRL
jgi:uncharacterized protein YhbP (UPF0306 family)